MPTNQPEDGALPSHHEMTAAMAVVCYLQGRCINDEELTKISTLDIAKILCTENRRAPAPVAGEGDGVERAAILGALEMILRECHLEGRYYIVSTALIQHAQRVFKSASLPPAPGTGAETGEGYQDDPTGFLCEYCGKKEVRENRVNLSCAGCGTTFTKGFKFSRKVGEPSPSLAALRLAEEALQWCLDKEPSPCRCVPFATPPHVCKGHAALTSIRAAIGQEGGRV